ncbi:Na+/H+ antiporter subunit E [Rhizobium rhizophilum]|uniref:Na+/H+ antiporter subunit E n=1 Tax=Rhizobium rhizophilum TaxID=1850373 RepID=A0ABY2QUK4_9HYPH|nr:Na+/H+ antiporter subunit E [Rhizobium rhizophilum]MBX9467300.1 Na+/H+ antiporter subunit E [Rhizobium sp.]THV14260.1 Na+/H+ antiporter subunit E [Rhizobium rhizophilum]
MSLYAISILMAVIWAAVSGSFTLLNVLFGFILSILTLYLLRERFVGSDYTSRSRRILSLVLLFLVELAKSAWRVATLVLRPKMDLKPGIFAYPLTVKSDWEISLLANLITLTPGTLSVDVSEDRQTLYVHALDCSDIEAARRDIAEGFEKKIMEAFA